MKLVDQVAIVTGGGGGIGSEIVAFLLDEGARVVSVDKFQPGKQSQLLNSKKGDRFFIGKWM